MYGPESSFTNRIPADSLRQIKPQQLVDKIKNLYKHDHYMLYYGTHKPDEVKAILSEKHPIPSNLNPIPDKREYTLRKTTGNQVFLADYDMVQAQVAMVARGAKHDTTLFPYARMYNQYYGSGLSSILFQEIRESKGLAYAVYGYFSSPDTSRHHVSRTFVGTQLNKMEDANEAIRELLTDMPKAKQQFQTAKTSILKNIETDRTTGASIFFSYLNDREAGFTMDRDRYIYNKVKSMTMADMERFFKLNIKQQDYDMMIMTDLDELDKKKARRYGKLQTLSREELFGYKVGGKAADRKPMPSATR
jgi:predicted Zn-dependent peptidase